MTRREHFHTSLYPVIYGSEQEKCCLNLIIITLHIIFFRRSGYEGGAQKMKNLYKNVCPELKLKWIMVRRAFFFTFYRSKIFQTKFSLPEIYLGAPCAIARRDLITGSDRADSWLPNSGFELEIGQLLSELS